MTDKQIIIDGVDVSRCKYWKGYCRIASLCDYPGHLCEVNPNCYYKQLKRKEDKINKIEDICDDILENYMKHSLACVDLAGKITDIIDDIKQEVNNDSNN